VGHSPNYINYFLPIKKPSEDDKIAIHQSLTVTDCGVFKIDADRTKCHRVFPHDRDVILVNEGGIIK